MEIIIGGIIGILLGLAVGFALLLGSKKKDQSEGNTIIKTAQEEAKRIRETAQEERKQAIQEAKDSLSSDRKRVDDMEKKAIEAEKRLEEKETKLDKKLDELVQKTESLNEQKEKLVEREESLGKKEDEIGEKLSKVAKLKPEEAKKQLFSQIESQYEQDFLGRIEKKKKELEKREEEVCREILVNAMQQYAGKVTAETTQTTVELADDELKGRIIGKEGRNIIALEKATGVNVIIDDTPNTVFISSYDLFRRYIAKKSIEQLVEDKRIQPARIEEVVSNNQRDAEKLILKLGEQILTEMGINGWDNEIVSLIGKLRFRTSYGQNILKHSQEVAYIAEAIAKQVGADARVALEGGILHDLGKALDHDIEGTHPEIGGKVLRKHGMNEKLVNITEAHHGGVPITCIETYIIMIADAISAVRPGARRANVEEYIKRLRDMEELVLGFE